MMTTTKTIQIKGGPALTMRRPTEAEVLCHLDKRQRTKAGFQVSADMHDNGGLEVLACVTSPSAEVMDELLEDCPRLMADMLVPAFLVLAASDNLVRRDDSVIADLPKKPRRAIGVVLGTERLVLSKLSRFEHDVLQLDANRGDEKLILTSALAALAKQHVLQPADPTSLWAQCPLLSAQLGSLLWKAAGAELEVELGESGAATKAPEATPSALAPASS